MKSVTIYRDENFIFDETKMRPQTLCQLWKPSAYCNTILDTIETIFTTEIEHCHISKLKNFKRFYEYSSVAEEEPEGMDITLEKTNNTALEAIPLQ